MFQNRDEGGRQLAPLFQGRHLTRSLVLAIPPGGCRRGPLWRENWGWNWT